MTPQPRPLNSTRLPIIAWVLLASVPALGLLIVLDGLGRLKLGQEGARDSLAFGFLLMALGIGVIILAYWLTHARRDWVAAGGQGAVAARPRVHLALAWGIALLCLAFIGFFLPSSWEELPPEWLLQSPGQALVLLALLAPFAWAVRLTLRRWRSAGVVFVPVEGAVMGGQLRGTIQTHLHGRPRSVTLTLTCLHRSVTGGRQVRETEETLWQGRHEVAVDRLQPALKGLSIPVSIPVPSARELSPPEWGTIEWRLAVRTRLAGPDLDAAFAVEVSLK